VTGEPRISPASHRAALVPSGTRMLSVTDHLRVVSLVPLPDGALKQIEQLDDSIEVVDATGWFDGEFRETWGDHTANGYLRPGSEGSETTRAERDTLLTDTDVVIGGFPMPVDLRARAPRLRWVHQTPAGASNLHRCDIWESDVMVTTSRGFGNTLAIAEYVVASFLFFSRNLHQAGIDEQDGTFRRSGYRPFLLSGKTACIIGAGGIGQEVGRLCNALGMRVVGTRRSTTEPMPPGFEMLAPPDRLNELLAESDFVAVCCQWTPETHNLLDAEAFAAMPDGAVLANVARGEIIDESALVPELDRFGGIALDVYVGEFDRQPPPELWHHPKVIITPHVSGGADSRSSRPIELFCQNLEALLAGRPLENVIDWSRGY
jgi:phosphoglycerate dehydrogenase-like enzyme